MALAAQRLKSRLAVILPHLISPCCGAPFNSGLDGFACAQCRAVYPIDSGLPCLYWEESGPQRSGEVTRRVREFYEDHPFPDYEDFDDLASLIDKAKTSVFARMLDRQLPFSCKVLECGCGTGQLSNFLGIANRSVIGTDISLPSLRLAEEFREKRRLERVYFLQMNLFAPVFPDESFDFVICNGVLHHTADPEGGFQRLARLVRPNGFLVVGLYHRYARLATSFRGAVIRWFGEGAGILDPRLRREKLGGRRRRAWIADQYRNPHESRHTVGEVLKWIPRAGLQFVRSIPKVRMLEKFDSEERLFEPETPSTRPERWLKELSLGLKPDSEGGFFTVIARKPS